MQEIQALNQSLLRTHRPAETSPPEEHSDALSQIFANLSRIEQTMRRHQHDCFDVIREDMEQYKKSSRTLHDERNFQGWSTLSLTFAGAFLSILAPCIASINAMDPAFDTLISELGGVESVEKLCGTLSKSTEGLTPVANVWSEAKASAIETDKQFLQLAYSRGQQTADQSNNSVDKLLNAALRLLEIDAKSKFN